MENSISVEEFNGGISRKMRETGLIPPSSPKRMTTSSSPISSADEELSTELLLDKVTELPPNPVIGMLDMDAFEVQIYLMDLHGKEKGRELYLTKPCILTTPNTYRIISANFLAKLKGISRGESVSQAQEKCPEEEELFVIKKTIRRGKQENVRLRHASWAVLDAILKYREGKTEKGGASMAVEYASNDEYFVDLTHQVNSHLEVAECESELMLTATFRESVFFEGETACQGYKWVKGRFHHLLNLHLKAQKGMNSSSEALEYEGSINELRIIVGAIILEDIKAFVFSETNFEASGGISVNKVLAKLACPLHKPAGVTILPREGLARVGANIPMEKLPSLGGERGKLVHQLVLSSTRDPENDEENIKKNEEQEQPVTILQPRDSEEDDENNYTKKQEGDPQPVQPVSIHQLATLPFSKCQSQSKELGLWTMLSLKRLAQGFSTEGVAEKLMKESLNINSSAHLRSLRFNMTFRIKMLLQDLVGELGERLKEEEDRHKRIAENINVHVYYIIVPRADEDRGKPPLVQNFSYPLSGEVSALKKDGDFIKTIMDEFSSCVKDKDGFIVKINFGVRKFFYLKCQDTKMTPESSA